MAFNLYIAENLDPAKSVVNSRLQACPIPMRQLVFGETIATNLYIVDGSGNFSEASGADGSTVKVGIGIPGNDPVWLNTAWTAVDDGWSGVLSPNTQDLLDLFDDGTFADLFFEVEVTNAQGQKSKYCSVPVRVAKRVINAAAATTPLDDSTDGQVAIDEGSDVVTVTGLDLAQSPRRVMVIVRKPAGGLNLYASVVGTPDMDGFTVNLNGQTDSPDYILDYIIIF